MLAVLILFFGAVLSDRNTEKGSVVNNEYIVFFHSYQKIKLLSDKVKTILRSVPSSTWRVIPRNCPAVLYPTDFLLLNIYSDETMLALKRSSEVKSIYPQKQYFGILNSYDDGHDVRNQTFTLRTLRSSDSKFMVNDKRGEASNVATLMNANIFWNKGFRGKGVNVAIFDTGIKQNHPHFRDVKMITDWTDESTADDMNGHGTFVAGIVASMGPSECEGFAADASLYVYRVFNSKRLSFTSWFLDAFNHAIFVGIHILNLSIGGPDFNDIPFVEKILELSANNIIVVSAIGNDGPTYGTLNNPADQLDVIGVGGVNYQDVISPFSSRGMTTWELPLGYGRIKPDILAFSEAVVGSGINGECKVLSGTSVASPVVTGAIALLASTLPEERRWQIMNPASIKQVLIESAKRIPISNIFEQGYGKIDLLQAYSKLKHYEPIASLSPPLLDLTECPYMWPYCTQPLYHSAKDLIVNVTILNGMGVTGVITGEPQWLAGKNGDHIELSFAYPALLWPWTGYLSVHIRVAESAAEWGGIAEGIIRLKIRSPPGVGEVANREQILELPLKLEIIPQPPAKKRILWDQFHSLRYPSGYFPRDSLKNQNQPFDWNGDHIHTNFNLLYNYLRKEGYYIEVLGEPLTCYNVKNYGALLIVDPEDEFFDEEIEKLHADIDSGLSVIIFSDWYNVDVMKEIYFFDENSKQWWAPLTGGSNVPAINELLEKYKISFGDRVYSGAIGVGENAFYFDSGGGIATFPKNGILVPFEIEDETQSYLYKKRENHKVFLMGFYQTEKMTSNLSNDATPGRISVFGDSTCLDASATHTGMDCFVILKDMLDYAMDGKLASRYNSHSPISSDYVSKRLARPKRMEGNSLRKYSRVVGKYLPLCEEKGYNRYNTSRPPVDVNWQIKNHFFYKEDIQMLERSDPVPPSFVPMFMFFFLFVSFLVYQVLHRRFKHANSAREGRFAP